MPRLPDKKRKRRPGGGRKPIDPQGVIVPVRFPKKDWEAITRAGERFKFKRAELIRVAVRYWLRLSLYPVPDVAALIYLITLLIERIEERSGRRWIKDAETAAAAREEIGYLIECFAPAAKERVVSPEFRYITSSLMAITAELARDPQLAPTLSEDNAWEALAMIAKELGPALLRKFTARVTITEIPASP